MSGFKPNLFVAAAARVLAGVLAAALLGLGLLAADGGFHQTLHQSGKASADNCVLCLFAKGQVDAPPAAPVVPAFFRSSLDLPPPMESIALVDFSYLTSLSRAPPALASLLPVAG